MKKTTLVAAMMVSMSVLSLGKVALATTIDGEGTADIEINGTIGKLDNTDPDEIIPEGTDEWVNITLDTATAFHTTTASKHKLIDSADYRIENNSGRGVQISLSNISGTQALVNDLTINGTIKHPTPVTLAPAALVSQGTLVNLTNSGSWMTLGNKEGKLVIDSDVAGTHGNVATFNFGGSTIEDLPANIGDEATAENYTLTLKFTALQADGVTVGV